MGTQKLLTAGGGGVKLTPKSSISSDVTVNIPSVTGDLVNTGSTAQVSQAMLASGVAGNGPIFSAYKSGATQDIGTAAWTKVTFESEEFDTNSNYDTSNSRFTPNVAGYYQFNCSIRFDNNGQFRMSLNKNGSSASKDGAWVINNFGISLSAIMYANGTTDYFEMYALSTLGYNVVAGISDTWFNGSLVRAA